MDKERKVKILQDLIQMKTVNGEEKQAAQYFKGLFEGYGIEANVIDHGDNRSSLVADMKGKEEGKTLALSGHFDVVMVDDESAWSHNPFGGEIENGRMYGRGTTDMKAGVAAKIIAMLELKEENADFNGSLRFLGTAGEEIGMVGSKELAEQGYANDIDGLILGEPSSGEDIHYAHKGLLNYTVKSKGQSGHSSSPDSVNAVEVLNDFMSSLQEEMNKIEEEYENEILGPTLHAFTVINGGTQPNSIPETAAVTAVVRTIPEFSNEQLIEKVEEVIEQVNENSGGQLELEVNQKSEPVITDPDSELVQTAKKVVGDQQVTGVGAVTDASSFSAGGNDFDLVMRGPGKMELAHMPDEYVEVDDYLDYIDEIKEIALTYLRS